MKYMTFNSSCSYAGLANLLSFYGVDTEDRNIALEMGLPFLFDYESGRYYSGPMLQGEKWFNLYLKPIGYAITEKEVRKEELCACLQGLKYAMLGIYVSEGNKHAVIYTGMKDGRLCMLNNKWEQTDEPDMLLLSKQDLSRRVDETAMVAVLNPCARETPEMESLLNRSAGVLQALGGEIVSFCAQKRSAVDIRLSMNTLFRAILLDGITMLDLIEETQISAKLKTVQGQLMNAVKENKPSRLDQCLDIPLLNDAVAEYVDLIHTHASARVNRQGKSTASSA